MFDYATLTPLFTDTHVLDILTKALVAGLKISAPILIAVSVAGLVLSLLMAVFQVQDQTLSMVPKYFVVAGVLAFLGNWMMQVIVEFSQELWLSIPTLVG